MMTDFEPIKSVKEQLASLADVLRTMRQRERSAEEAMSAAENELNAIRKLRGFCEIEIGALRRKLAALEAET
jgi:predicted  nucleic acid-binding Zn-ribbon protein